MTTQKTRFFPLQATSKIDYKSYKTQRTRYHEKQSSKEEHGHGWGSGTTTCPKLLLGRTNRHRLHCFLQKDGHSASKAKISSTAGQHGPREACRHPSTQAQHDVGSGVDLHWTVAGRARKINPELLDEGTYPTSQDFLQLPPRASWFNAATRLVYL